LTGCLLLATFPVHIWQFPWIMSRCGGAILVLCCQLFPRRALSWRGNWHTNVDKDPLVQPARRWLWVRHRLRLQLDETICVVEASGPAKHRTGSTVADLGKLDGSSQRVRVEVVAGPSRNVPVDICWTQARLPACVSRPCAHVNHEQPLYNSVRGKHFSSREMCCADAVQSVVITDQSSRLA
jgi:hypothetical protein